MQERQYSTILDATAFSLGSGIGWFIAIVAIAAIREKIRYSNVPAPLRGLGITFIITGLMGMAFMSFMGIKYADDTEKKDDKQGINGSSIDNQVDDEKTFVAGNSLNSNNH